MEAGTPTLVAASLRKKHVQRASSLLSESFRDEKVGKGDKIFELWLEMGGGEG